MKATFSGFMTAVIGSAVTMVPGHTVHAQDDSDFYIEEIVVTAQKREQGLQDVPIAVSAFSADSLDRLNIDDALDIQYEIPNAVLTGNDRWTIRGIGNNALSSTADNGTPVITNGAFVGGAAQNEFFDIERIEVLRGPQGTLYGRNTTGGVVNIITRKPTDEFGGNIYVEAGNFSTAKVKGALNLPISDSIGQRFAVFYLKRDGYTENEFTGNDIDDRDQYALRSTTSLTFGNNTDATLTLQYYDEDSSRARENKRLCKQPDPTSSFPLGCLPNELAFDSPLSDRVLLQQLLVPFTGLFYPAGANIYDGAPNPTDLRTVAADTDPTYVADEFVATLEINHDFGDYTFTWLTGYSDAESEANTDWDNAALPFRFLVPIEYGVARDQRITTDRLLTTDSFVSAGKTWSQELRLVSDYDSMFNFTAGLFYLNRETSAGDFFIWHPALELLPRLVFGLPPESWYLNAVTPFSRTETYAVFGESYFNLSDRTRLTVGLRWTDERKAIRTRTILLSPPGPFTVDGKSWNRWTGKLAIDHTMDLGFTDETLLYASFSHGYKGGGLNVGNTVDPDFEPEEVNAFEIGAKNSLANDRLRANLTAFYYDYTDLQLAQRIAAAAVTENADATVWGIETEFAWAPGDSWLLDLNVAYLNTEIDEFITQDAANPLQDPATASPDQLLADDPATPNVEVSLEGNQLPHSPEFSVKFGAQYSIPLTASGWEATARLDYFMQDDYFSREFNTPNDAIDSWDVVNLSVRFANEADTLAVEFFGKNLQDNDNITNSIIEDPLVGAYRNVRILEPRTWGIILEAKF